MIWPAIAGAAVSTVGGFALNKLFGGGGSSGGGGMDISGILPESLPFVNQYLEDQFNLAGTNNFNDYFSADPVKKKEGRELAGVIGKSMFGGNEPTRRQVKDAYNFAKVTGNTGSSNQAQQAISSYFAQSDKGMKNRLPSSQELLAGMKYGPLVGTESGVKLFAGTPRTNEMFDRIDGARNYRADKFSSIFNT